ncbi:MAG: rhodanese-like domain-containing protein [bacterium]|jgi:rhodanese-related sulfurtransferase|nr:rhodanese-like domain-containing protein [Betaproteobacteria bacterium]
MSLPSIEALLERARERARALGAPYAGSLEPAEAWALLQHDAAARLVDVRSRAEWEFVGRVPGAVEIEWKSWPGMVRNEAFLDTLSAQAERSAPLLFLCRSGGRSHDAALAATAAGFGACFNVLQGFEGDRDAAAHRNTIGGWRAAGLPWSQG